LFLFLQHRSVGVPGFCFSDGDIFSEYFYVKNMDVTGHYTVDFNYIFISGIFQFVPIRLGKQV